MKFRNVKTGKEFEVVKLRKNEAGKIIAVVLKGPAGIEFEQEFDKAQFEMLGYELIRPPAAA